eukprot:GCRY01002242.1.p1 GENE.GCRY01002242.1~~GCRY01002242.1.p1  ORF type:complete len:325 (-),score=61.63 GCRY01002242.1:8-865(-)
MENNTWTQLHPTGDEVEGRWGHKAFVHGDSMWIIGGGELQSEEGVSVASYHFETNVYKQHYHSGEIKEENGPNELDSFAAVLIDDRIYCFGEDGENDALTGVYRYSLSSNAWDVLETTQPPPSLSGAEAVRVEDGILLIHGLDNKKAEHSGTIWKLNLSTFQWDTLPQSPAGYTPPPTSCFAIFPLSDTTFLAAGGDCDYGISPTSFLRILHYESNTCRWEAVDSQGSASIPSSSSSPLSIEPDVHGHTFTPTLPLGGPVLLLGGCTPTCSLYSSVLLFSLPQLQ